MATNHSVGSEIFAVTALLVIALGALLVIRHYLPLRSTPAYLLVPVFLALALPCSIVLLVPIDLASTAGDDTSRRPPSTVWLPASVILVTWRITYWLTFVLTWFILPFLGDYCDSGYRDPRSRTFDSLRTNVRYQLIVLAAGVVGLVYFILENGFHIATLKGLVIALAYAWGLFLAIGLMGHGLVALPRRLFKNARVSARLRSLQTLAPLIKEKLDDATEKLVASEQTLVQLGRHKGGASREQQDWIDELLDTSPMPDSSRAANLPSISTAGNSVPNVVTDRYLADLTRRLRRARHLRARFAHEFSILCSKAQDAQTILDAATTKKLDFGRTSSRSRIALLSNLHFVTPTMRFYLYMHAVPLLRMFIAALLALASILVVWSEVINPFLPHLSVIGLSVAHRASSAAGGRVDFLGQLLSASWLLYMDACALYAISDVKVWGNRALVRRQTYAESACWYSLQVAKLTVPLSFNFITLMPESVYEDTRFYQFLGQLIDLTPLGQGFSAFFPCVLLLPVLATSFNLYGKMKDLLGFGVLDDESDDYSGGWREGRLLIERGLQLQGSNAAEDSAVGLADRGPSLDLESAAAAPSSSLLRYDDRPARPPTQDPRIAEREPRVPAPHASSRNATVDDDDDGPRHFYQDIAERVRNTFDTVERPEWVAKIGGAFKTPKWMQSQPDETGNTSLGRWFGGRAEDGRVRL